MYISNGNRCSKCGKPYIYVGDIPESGWVPGMEPYCTCAEKEQKSKISNPLYGWVCPTCGKVYAPWVDRCDQCPRTTTSSTNIGSW